MDISIERRKHDHLRLCLEEEVAGEGGNGLEHYRFYPTPIPEIHFDEIETSTVFLDKPLTVPYLVSSMTGGTEQAVAINRRLAKMAERRGWAMAVGSGRAALEKEALRESFQLRGEAPTVPIIANIGAVQLNYGYDAAKIAELVGIMEADALVLHFNSLQEVFQDEGDVHFGGLLAKVASLCEQLDVPVGVKEVGCGIGGAAAFEFVKAGVAFVDVAGSGGTSWIKVEQLRSRDPVRLAAADAFADWGIPTAECIVEVRETTGPHLCLIASGGLSNGVEAAKALALGANLAGFGRQLLGAAMQDEEALELLAKRLEFELRVAMFGIGAARLESLRGTTSLQRRQR